MTTRYYTLFYKRKKGMGESAIFTNLKQLSDFVGKNESFTYDKLLEHFSRKKMGYYEDPYNEVMIIKSTMLIKGAQRIIRSGNFGSSRHI